uniref:Uncharacterized protein n=1 Tax=Anguilla anguilla TaxID=7936 RepID=A0A0E9PKC7_ANGAN
MNCLACGTNHI